MMNPYTKTFGKEPKENIPRTDIVGKVCDAFHSENPESPIYILSGIRGSGKTVTMTEIIRECRKGKDWITIEINSSSSDMLRSMAAQLYAQKTVFSLVSKARINLSLLGMGAEIQGEPPISDHATAIARILDQLKRNGQKVLITIDEIVVSEATKELIKQFQIYIRENYPVFMVVTGINKTIEALSNADGMTFLYRAPRVPIEPLDKIAAAGSYERCLGVSRETAIAMSKLTKGYSFAFQVLGYLCFESGRRFDEIVDSFDHEMYEKVYRKVWMEMSAKEKEALHAMAVAKSSRVKDIREVLNVDTNHFNPLRRRLIDQGLVISESDGYLSFTLPRFREFARDMYLLEG